MSILEAIRAQHRPPGRPKGAVSSSTSAWPEDKVERLKALTSDGKTAGEIGRELGVSRNAVIGKWTRLGLKSQSGKTCGIRAGAAPRRPSLRKARVRKRKPSIFDIIGQPDTADVVDNCGPRVPPGANSTTLRDVRAHQCRWIDGAPAALDTIMCGDPVAAEGLPYCAAHCRIAYTRAHLRRRELGERANRIARAA